MNFKNGTHYLEQLKNFLIEEVYPIANELDTNSELLKSTFAQYNKNKFFCIYIPIQYGGLPLSPQETVVAQEMIGRWAGALGFLQVQQATTTWALLQSENESLKENVFKSLLTNEYIIGNATSHLKENKKDAIVGTKHPNGYLINGFNPFISGLGIYNKIAMGFNTEDNKEVFAFINIENLPSEMARATPIFNMSSMQSLNTVGINFSNYFIKNEDIIGVWEKFRFIREYKKRPAYAFPLGIAIQSLDIIKNELPEIFLQEYLNLNKKIDNLKQILVQEHEPVNVFAMMIKLAFQCISFSIFIAGGKSLLLSNHLQRLQRELNVWLIPRCSPAVIKAWLED